MVAEGPSVLVGEIFPKRYAMEGGVDDPWIVTVNILVVDDEIDWIDWKWMILFLVWERPCTVCEYISRDI
jgi:hypothetical protein